MKTRTYKNPILALSLVILPGSLLLANPLRADTLAPTTWACTSECMIIDYQNFEVADLGPLVGTDDQNAENAFTDLKNQCASLINADCFDPEEPAVLAKSVQYYKKDESSSSKNWDNQHSETVTPAEYGYSIYQNRWWEEDDCTECTLLTYFKPEGDSWSSSSTGNSSSFRDSEHKVDVIYAQPGDKDVCIQAQGTVKKRTINPKYCGPGKPLG